jgi:hypothetical protein
VSEILSGITALLSAAMNDLQIENQTSLIVNTSTGQVNGLNSVADEQRRP